MILFRHPILLLLIIIVVSIFGPKSFIETYVYFSLFCLLFNFDFRLPWEAMGGLAPSNVDRDELTICQNLALVFLILFRAYHQVFFLYLLENLPLCLKVPLYKALFLVLLVPLPFILALSLPDTGEEEGEEQETN